MDRGSILLASFLAIFILGGPIASVIGTHDGFTGIMTGVIVYVLLSAVFGQRGQGE